MTLADAGSEPPDNVEELLRRYAAGERIFTHIDLSEAHLTGVCLSKCTFDNSWFFDANFEGADLRGASFRSCNVKCASFRRADLRGCSFELAGIESADFEDAQLDGAIFIGATCYGYTIKEGDLFP